MFLTILDKKFAHLLVIFFRLAMHFLQYSHDLFTYIVFTNSLYKQPFI